MHHLGPGQRRSEASVGVKRSRILAIRLTAVFSRDELLIEKFRSTKAHSCPFAGDLGGAGDGAACENGEWSWRTTPGSSALGHCNSAFRIAVSSSSSGPAPRRDGRFRATHLPRP